MEDALRPPLEAEAAAAGVASPNASATAIATIQRAFRFHREQTDRLGAEGDLHASTATSAFQIAFRRHQTLQHNKELEYEEALHERAVCGEGYSEGVVYTEGYSDGSVYEGSFRMNRRDGSGRLAYANGDVYEGQFRCDLRHGLGRMLFVSGDFYAGEFCDDEPEGHGVRTSAGGAWRYDGRFFRGLRHGEGVSSFARSDIPQALLDSGRLSGAAQTLAEAASAAGSVRELVEVMRTSGRYLGQFRQGLRHGRGRVELLYDSDACAGYAAWPAAGGGAVASGARCVAEGTWREGHQHGPGVVHFEGHLRYEGELRGDLPEGLGRLTRCFGDGASASDVFQGCFCRGAAHGRGSYAGPHGTTYEGEFAEGLRHGRGELKVRNTTYEGEFRHGLRHGAGQYSSHCVEYVGEYRNGERHGCGKLTERSADGGGSSYEGEFAESLRHGQGSLQTRACQYDGAWRHNMRHERGRQVWHASGDAYEGLWEADRMQGSGTLTTQSIRYTGEFVAGELQGEGVQVWLRSSGEVGEFGEAEDEYEGHFFKSKPHGHGTFFFRARGESYAGGMVEGRMDGSGVYTYADGSHYRGSWLRGKQHGEGELAYANGAVYRGQFVGDAFQGAGVFTEPHGRKYDGKFRKDHMFGEASVSHPGGQNEIRLYDGHNKELGRRSVSRGGRRSAAALADAASLSKRQWTL